VPSVRRRITVLLGAACLAAAVPAVPALAQGAGDQQYQDPFGGSGTSTTQSGSGGSGSQTQTTPSGNLEPLSPSPQNAGSGGSSGSSGSSSGGTTTTPAAPATPTQGLPNTGADVRLLVLAGGALLLIGLGLRLRSAPERF
jgi:LPXTG-motif cell wall-anchored protein